MALRIPGSDFHSKDGPDWPWAETSSSPNVMDTVRLNTLTPRKWAKQFKDGDFVGHYFANLGQSSTKEWRGSPKAQRGPMR